MSGERAPAPALLTPRCAFGGSASQHLSTRQPPPSLPPGHVQVLPIKALGTLISLLTFWFICRMSFLLPASVRTLVVAKLGNWACRVCLFWLGFWRVSWIRVGLQGGTDGHASGSGSGGSNGKVGSDGDAPPVGIVSNHISW